MMRTAAPWVLPKAVRPTAGAGGAAVAPAAAIAATAAATRSSWGAVTGLGPPSKSPTEKNMAMSESPTNGRTFPEATVERIALGSPIGKARMAVAATAVPWLPPTATTAASRPARSSTSSSRPAPRPIASMAAARSPSERSVARLAPAASATAAAPTSASGCGPSSIPTS